MEERAKQVVAKTGIPEDQARTAVTTVLGFLEDKLQAPLAGQINIVSVSGEGGLGNIASTVGGFLK